MSNEITPFEAIRRTNSAGNEYWSSRDFARVLGYTDYRNFEAVIAKARTACFNSGQRLEDHFVDITEMVEIGSGAQRALKTAMMASSGSSRPSSGPIGKPAGSSRSTCCSMLRARNTAPRSSRDSPAT